MKLKITKIALAALLVVTQASFAETQQESLTQQRDSGAYAELNLGSLYESINFWGYHYHAFNAVGGNTNLGYQFGRNFGIEAGYTYYGNSLNNVDIAAKVIVPFTIGTQQFNVFAKLGPAYVFRKGDSSVLPYGGLGAGYSVNKNLDITVQTQGITNGFFNLGLISLGVAYHF